MSEKVHFLLETNNPISGKVKTFVPKAGGVVGSSVEGEVPAGKPRSALLIALRYALFVEGDSDQVFSSAEAVGQVASQAILSGGGTGVQANAAESKAFLAVLGGVEPGRAAEQAVIENGGSDASASEAATRAKAALVTLVGVEGLKRKLQDLGGRRNRPKRGKPRFLVLTQRPGTTRQGPRLLEWGRIDTSWFLLWEGQ